VEEEISARGRTFQKLIIERPI